MKVIIIGAGRYGNELAGRMYLKHNLGANLIGVVDPNIDKIKQSASYCLKGVPTFHSIDELPVKMIKSSVMDIAVHPKYVPDIFTNLVNKGAKKIILPKPVAEGREEFDKIVSLSQRHNADSLVASNWHYSKITEFLKSVLTKSTKNDAQVNPASQEFMKKIENMDSGYNIDRVKIEYNKKDEKLTIAPPFQEMPHAVQIVHSTGLADLEKTEIYMEESLQSRSCVDVIFDSPSTTKNGLELISDLKKGDKLAENRERLANIHLEKNGEKSLLVADYNAEFDNTGVCIKEPGIQFYSADKSWKQIIEEDNMNTMYTRMVRFFEGEKNDSLTVEDYYPISNCLNKINEQWENALTPKKKKNYLFINK